MKNFLVLVVGVVFGIPQNVAHSALVFANTTGGRLISFDTAAPGTLLSDVNIIGVVGSLVGIDVRPATGQLYGVGNSGGTGTIYTINPTTGVATSVTVIAGALSGTNFGVDFNPVPDALRIVSDTNQNLRIAGFPSNTFVTNVDGNLSLSGVVSAAYSNNFAGTATTTLYDIRSTDSSLYIQNPPNNGTLGFVGALGTSTNGLVGFDISGATGIAYASLNGGANFGTINLATGAFTNIGAIGGFAGQVSGISLQAVPEPSSALLLSIGMGLVGVCLYRRGMMQPKRLPPTLAIRVETTSSAHDAL